MAQRLNEVAKRPARPKPNRKGHKHVLSQAPGWDPDRLDLEAEVDERHFAHITADIVVRAGDVPPLRLVSPPEESSNAEFHKSRFLGSTAGILVYKGEATASVIEAPNVARAQSDPIAADNTADEVLRRLRGELAALTATLADRETALAKAVFDLEQARESRHHESEAAERSKTAEAEHVTEAEAQCLEPTATSSAQSHDRAEEEIRRLRHDSAALRATLADREAALAKAHLDLEQAQVSWQRESQAAEAASKAAEAARLTEAEAQWREQTAISLAEAHAQGEAARNQTDEEIRRLHHDSAALRATLADREAALAKAYLDLEQAQASWQRESQAAEVASKAAEAARLTEAEAQWREQTAISLAEAHAREEAARHQTDEQIRRLLDDSAALRATLADREAALAKSALDHERARLSWQEESQAALSKAELAWKAAEAVRFAEAEANWREQSERVLTELRAQSQAALDQTDVTIRGLQDQLAALQITLTDREAVLAQATLDHEQTRERGRQEMEAASAKAKAWEAGEAQRLAAAQAQWHTQSANALAEATARYQAAEGMLTQLRMQSDRARSDAVGGSARSDAPRATFGAKPVAREPDPAPIRLPGRDERGSETRGSKVIIQPQRMMSAQEARPPKTRGAFRDIVVVASIAVMTILAYPRIEPLLPDSVRSNIAAIMGRYAPSASLAPQGSASVLSDVNLRVEPSTTAAIITTLPRGSRVGTIERRGDWTLVQVEGNGSNAQPRRGWVFASFLSTDVDEGIETEPSDDSE